MAPTTATPAINTGPGYLFYAPVGTTIPTNTVAGSVFTDAWPVAWVNLGATESGSTFDYQITLNPIDVAEFVDPIGYRTTARAGKFAFNLANFTAANLARALNGSAPQLVSGTGATALNKVSPPVVNTEIRCMIGYESADSTTRIVGYQCINGAQISIQFAKAPQLSLIQCEFNFEIPSSGNPYDIFTAGSTRQGV